ncbi:MAG: hypothetical protein H6Q53_1750 [Deltaproteobacteria bacterium]|nr:hypothetical protein [Deltaproteobacteria bacterium]
MGKFFPIARKAGLRIEGVRGKEKMIDEGRPSRPSVTG